MRKLNYADVTLRYSASALSFREKIEAAKKELNSRLGGKKYECPIPKDIIPQAIKPKK